MSFHAMQMALPMASGRTSFLFESPQISMTMMHFEPPTRTQTVDAVEAICHKHGVSRASVAGHSFGTILTGWLANAKPHLVAQAIFADPACFLLCLPGTSINRLNSCAVRGLAI